MLDKERVDRCGRWFVLLVAAVIVFGSFGTLGQAAPAAVEARAGSTAAIRVDESDRNADRTSALTGIYERVSPAVVRVYYNNRSYSSGTVVTADGLLITHIDIAKRDKLNVLTSDGRILKAKVLLRDAPTQLAVLRLLAPEAATAPDKKDEGERPAQEAKEPEDKAGEPEKPVADELSAISEEAMEQEFALPDDDPSQASEGTEESATPPADIVWPFIAAGGNEPAAIGSWVATVAYPVGSDMKKFTQPAFSAGLLAGRGKMKSGLKYDGDLLLTDATANTGSQGGAMLDAQGRLVGILMLPIYYRPTNSALNVALPVEVIEPLLKRAVESPDPPMAKEAEDEEKQAAYLGVIAAPDSKDCRVAATVPGGPAADGGIAAGDLIKAVDGKAVATFAELAAALGQHKPGDEVTLTVLRPGRGAAGENEPVELKLKVTLGARE